MAKKKVELRYNPNWTVWYEYQHGRDVIIPGTEIKFKYNKHTYRFQKYVINSKTKSDWIDVVGPDGFRSFHTEDLKGIIKPKKKRINKKNE